VDSPKSWEEQICREAQLPERDWWKLIVTVPGYDTKLNTNSGAFVVRKRPSGSFLEDFYDASPILRNILTILVPERHILRVLVTEDLAGDVTKLSNAANELFLNHQAETAAEASPASPVPPAT
jgi:hypothetical protein